MKALRRGADIVVACPGRLVDHLATAPSCALNGSKILVLDEADRMCDMGFLPASAASCNLCPKERQTLFFSATMPDDIRTLAQRDPQATRDGTDRLIAPARPSTHAFYPVADKRKKRLLWRCSNRPNRTRC